MFEVIWHQLTLFDRPSWILIFSQQFKKQKLIQNQAKLLIKCEFLQFNRENWKKIQNSIVKKVDVWLNIHEICGYHGNIRNNRLIWQFLQRVIKQLLTVSVISECDKTLWGWHPPHSFVHPRVNSNVHFSKHTLCHIDSWLENCC